MSPELQFKIDHLPESPGCYLMKSGDTVIYVGKAKNLKNRVRQYFQSSKNHTPKVQAMVGKVDDFELVLVDGELEALILECNLIKRYKPYYNILLKDDKHYPYLGIDLAEPFPRVQIRRRIEKDGLRYFGPYKSATVLREMLDVLRMVFPIRVCEKKLDPDKALRPCVHHQVGQCLAPCAGQVSQADYLALIRRVMDFLSGKFEPVLRELNERMQEAAQAMQYERAAVYRDRIRAVQAVAEKQKAIAVTGVDQDVLAAMPEGFDALVERVTLRDGKMIDAQCFVLPRAGDEPISDILTSFVLQHYDERAEIPAEILIPEPLADQETLETLLSETRGKKARLHVPERGEKKRLLEMAQKNLRETALKRTERLARSYARTKGALIELADALGLPEPPRRVEGYDISNTQGAQSVGSMVVMIDGLCVNREYRHFRIKTVEGANDFASMREVLLRRLTHGLRELEERNAAGLPAQGGRFSDLPDLILIDGGAGQLAFALDAMKEAGCAIPMFGLAKRIEEIVLPGRDETLLLDRHSEALNLIKRLRDEAHRFGITLHRSLRAKASVASVLDGIPGIGARKKKALLARFHTIEALRAADEGALCETEGIGPGLAKILREALAKEGG